MGQIIKALKDAEILVDLYNLDLTKSTDDLTGTGINAPSEDRQAIIEFFEKHAPGVTTFKTTEELDAAQKEKKELDAFDTIGSLGLYEQQRHQSWFDANVANFYRLIQGTRAVIDTHLSEALLSSRLLMWVNTLLTDAHPIVVIEDKAGRKYSAGNAPTEIDQEEYTFAQDISITTGRLHSDSSKTELGFGLMHYKLFNAVLSLWNGEIKIRICEHEKCNNIFILGSGRYKKQYCSGAHRVAAFRQRQEKAVAL